MDKASSILDVANEEFANDNKPLQQQEPSSLFDIAESELKNQPKDSSLLDVAENEFIVENEIDPVKLKELKQSGQKINEKQERAIFDYEDQKPVTDELIAAASAFIPAAAQSFSDIAVGGYELGKQAILKPVIVGAKYQLGLATAKDTQEAAKSAGNALRSLASGVASDVEETANAATRMFMYGSTLTDKLQGLPADERYKRYRLREDMRTVEQSFREGTPDRAAALLSENPILKKITNVAVKMQGGTEEDAKEAERIYSELVLESGLTKDELNERISKFGEFVSPLSIPGANLATKTIGKVTEKAVQKGGEAALKGIVKPVAKGVRKTAEFIETAAEKSQDISKNIGEYLTGDPDTLIKSSVNTIVLPIKKPVSWTGKTAGVIEDVARQVDVGGAAGRRGLFERAGRAAESGDFTKALFSPESMGGIGRARAADWLTRQSNAIIQQGVNGSALNVMMGLPDIETGEQLGQVAGSGFGIGAVSGSRIMERFGAAIDPRTGLAQKIDAIITPNPASLRADEDADIKRFLSTVDPDLIPKMEQLANIDARKKAIQDKIDNLQKQKDVTFGPEVQNLDSRIENYNRQLEALNKSTPETQKEILRQVHLAFADQMDAARTTGKAAGLNNIQVKILDPSEMDGFFRNLYGTTLTNAEQVIASLTGNPNLTPQETENLANARLVVDQFYNEVGSAQAARGLAISDVNESSGEPVPEFMRKQNLQGATVLINGDLVKQLSNEGFNIQNTIGHEIQHALSNFKEVREMLAPIRQELFDQKIKNEDGSLTTVTKGIYSDDKLDAFADVYAAAMSPSDNGASFKSQFNNTESLRAYIKDEILSEITGRSGNILGGNRAALDSVGRSVVDWIEVKTKSGALKVVKEALRKAGIIVDESGDVSTILGAELTPESLAMVRQYQRQLKDMNQSMVYDNERLKENVEIPIAKILSDRALQERFKDSDIFQKEQVVTMIAPDGNKTELPIPDDAGVDPFVGTYRVKNGQIVDESGTPVVLGTKVTFGNLPDGTEVQVGTRIARNIDGSPKILSNREIEARSRNRGKIIRNAIDSAIQKGITQLEDTGNGNYRGVMSEQQVAAVLALPNSIVAPNLKRQILFVNELLRRKDGTRMEMEYQAAMRGGKSRALSPQIKNEIPIGFQFSKQGNFLITTMSVSRMNDKVNAWLAKKPENLKLWNGDTASFWDDVIKVLDNHSKGEVGQKGLDEDPAIALEKKHAVNDLFNVWNAETKAANPRRTKLPPVKGKDPEDVIVRSRRIDRINQYFESPLQKMPFNYELVTKNYMPAENPLADFQTPEEFANLIPSVTSEQIKSAIDSGNTDLLELNLRDSDDLKPGESLDVDNGKIRIVSMFDPQFMPEESVDYIDQSGIDKRRNIGISFMPAKEEDYAYRGTHKAPDQENGSPLHEVTKTIYPPDFYTLPFDKALQYYGSGDDVSDRESLSAILSAKGNKNAKVKVYRAVPNYVGKVDLAKTKEIEDRIEKYSKLVRQNPWSEDFKKQLEQALSERPQQISSINAGDWVTPSRSYAVDHGESALNGDYRILSKSVPASHLFTEGNSLSEFGYNPPAKGIQFMPSETERYPTSERGFYSGLQKTIDQKVHGKFASPDQLKAIINNPQNVKAEELKWSGVLDEIDRLASENQGKVPKDKVMEYLRNEGAVKFEEVTIREVNRDDIPQSYITQRQEELLIEQAKELAYENNTSQEEEYDRIIRNASILSETAEQARDEYLSGEQGNIPKYAQYQLPGGENYREVVMTMPIDKNFLKQKEGEENRLQEVYKLLRQDGLTQEERKILEKEKLDLLTSLSERRPSFTSSHFEDIPNYVAHMRVNDRETLKSIRSISEIENSILKAVPSAKSAQSLGSGAPISALNKGLITQEEADAYAEYRGYTGFGKSHKEKGLFIEELQSDRHQAGREKGYNEDQPQTGKDYKNLGWKAEKDGDTWDIYSPEGRYIDSKVADSEVDALDKMAKRIAASGSSRSTIPDAPFRKDWGVQLFKRALRDAVDSDKKWIGWTTGIEQVKRYEDAFRKAVDEIEWTTPAGKPKAFGAIKDGKTILAGKINDDGTIYDSGVLDANGKQLSEVVGKEIAARIISENSGTATGNDLTVGGEGMKGFYDQILPKEIGKYVAKMGGKVEKSEIERSKLRIEKDGNSFVVVGEDNSVLGSYDSQNEAQKRIEDLGGFKPATPIWRVNITPEMAGKVKGGQLQFMPEIEGNPLAGPDEPGYIPTIEVIKAAKKLVTPEQFKARVEEIAFGEDGTEIGDAFSVEMAAREILAEKGFQGIQSEIIQGLQFMPENFDAIKKADKSLLPLNEQPENQSVSGRLTSGQKIAIDELEQYYKKKTPERIQKLKKDAEESLAARLVNIGIPVSDSKKIASKSFSDIKKMSSGAMQVISGMGMSDLSRMAGTGRPSVETRKGINPSWLTSAFESFETDDALALMKAQQVARQLTKTDQAKVAAGEKVEAARASGVRESTKEQGMSFVIGEKTADQKAFGSSLREDLNAPPRVYASIVEGQKFGSQGNYNLFFEWDKNTPMVITSHHHYGVGNGLTDIHASANIGDKNARSFGDVENEKYDTLPSGKKVLDTYLLVGNDGASDIRTHQLMVSIPSSGIDNVKRAFKANGVEGAKSEIDKIIATQLVGQPSQGKTQTFTSSEGVPPYVAVQKNRTEAYVLNPDLSNVKKIIIASNSQKEIDIINKNLAKAFENNGSKLPPISIVSKDSGASKNPGRKAITDKFFNATGKIAFMPEQPTEYESISARIRPLEGISAPTKVVGAKAPALGEIEPPMKGKVMLPDIELKPTISEKPKSSEMIGELDIENSKKLNRVENIPNTRVLDKSLKTVNGSRYYNIVKDGEWYAIRIADHAQKSSQYLVTEGMFNRQRAKNANVGMSNPHDINIVIDEPIKNESQAANIINKVLNELPKNSIYRIESKDRNGNVVVYGNDIEVDGRYDRWEVSYEDKDGNSFDEIKLKPISEKGIQSSDIITSAKPATDAVIKPYSNALVSSAGLINFLPAYHGTPHEIPVEEGFKMSKIGTGEGAQAYGYGLYFAQARQVGEEYRKQLSKKNPNAASRYYYEGSELPPVAKSWQNQDPKSFAIRSLSNVSAGLSNDQKAEWAIKNVRRVFPNAPLEFEDSVADAARKATPNALETEKGNLYKVDLDVKDEDLLDWDKPLSEQPESVRDALTALIKERTPKEIADVFLSNAEAKGGSLYALISDSFGESAQGTPEKRASEALLAAGIPGIRYLDQKSRATTGGKITGIWQGEQRMMEDKGKGKWFARIQVKDRSVAFINSPTSVTTTSMPFNTREEAQAWAEKKISEGTYNYVIFDENLIKILDKNDKPVEGDLPKPTSLQFMPAEGEEKITETAVINKDGNIISSTKKNHAMIMEETDYDLDSGEFPPMENFGFLTNTGRFVTQKEAQEIAKKSNQVVGNQQISGEIVSAQNASIAFLPESIDSSTSVKTLTDNENYNEAKYNGNPMFGYNLARKYLTQDIVDSVNAKIDPEKPAVIIPVSATEGEDINTIPLAVADALSWKLNIPISTDIVKTSSAHNTGAPANARSRTIHNWDGKKPAPGTQIILVDDTYTTGQTLKSLASYVGEPTAIVTLASGRYGKQFDLSAERENKMLAKAGITRDEFISLYGQEPKEQLTGAQAQQYILNGQAGKEGLLTRFPAQTSQTKTGSNTKVQDRSGKRRIEPDEYVGLNFTPQDKDNKYAEQMEFAFPKGPKTLTYFSGIGTWEQGLKGEIDPQYAVEYDPAKAAAYRAANGDHMIEGDVTQIDPQRFKGIEYFHASPVCKNYSILKDPTRGGEENDLDIRSADAVNKVLKTCKPKFFTLENVGGYRKSEAYKSIKDTLLDLGYKFDDAIYNANEYGSPTDRKRLLLRATLVGDLPAPIKKQGGNWYDTVSDIVNDLPDAPIKGANFIWRELNKVGIDPENVPYPILIAGGGSFKQVPWRSPDEPAYTFTTNQNNVDRILLPGGISKRVTGRAKARMSGFDDSLVLPENDKLANIVIGNGVPPDLVKNVIGPMFTETTNKK